MSIIVSDSIKAFPYGNEFHSYKQQFFVEFLCAMLEEEEAKGHHILNIWSGLNVNIILLKTLSSPRGTIKAGLRKLLFVIN